MLKRYYALALAFVLASLLISAPAAAQTVSPDQIAQIAKTIHDAEGWDLGANSSRSTRNEFWAFVVGVVHFGHSRYNPTPDPRWCIKDGGGGRPQSDDVAVLCDTREFWDFIGGVGANGYTFRAGEYPGERLPPVQNVYPPPRPKDSGVVTPPPSGGGGTVQPPAATVNLQPLFDRIATLEALVVTKLDAIAGLANELRADVEAARVNASDLRYIVLPAFEERINAVLEPFKAGFPAYRGRILGAPITLNPQR